MVAWFSANWVTIVVLGILCLIVFGIVRGMIRDKKRGKSVTCGACFGDCAHCRAAHDEAIRAARASKANTGK